MHFRILLILISASLSVTAQHNHYIYIQSDNAQNFYIRKGTEITSSSSSGFVILPRIIPGQQEFVIGFPKNEFPEYQFAIEIKGKDRGFALKNFNEKGWGLFDLQSLEVIMGRKVEVQKELEKTETGPLTSDPFSVILASAVGDQRIRQTSLVYHEDIIAQNTAPAKTETINHKSQVVPKTETAVAKTSVPVKKDPVITNPATTNPVVSNPKDPALESAALSAVEPSKKEETARKTEKVDSAANRDSSLVKPETIASAAVVTDKKETAANTSGVPGKKEKPSEHSGEPLQTEPTRIKSEPVNETGNAKKTGLFKKNPFARKTPEPVKSEPGVVMISGGPDKETTGEKKGKEAVKETDLATGSTIKDSSASKETTQALKHSEVVKYSESKKNGETMLVFIDRQSNHDDTIRISITEDPVAGAETDKITAKDTLSSPGLANAAPVVPVSSVKPPAAETENLQKKENDTKAAAGKPLVETKDAAPNAKDSSSVEKKEPVMTASGSTGTRTDCRKMATEKDMVAMRKKMIMMADEDEMIALALKDFKSRCYSTERIQNLSYVFTTDKGRYKLFDAAFPYVYDPSNFTQLERLLNEDYYIKRFRALVNQN